MAYGPRESSFMPTIKCSMCAMDIEISQMGDHVCGGPPAGEPTPPPDSNNSFDRTYGNGSSNGSGLLKPGRQMPPKVDTSAANRPYFRPQEITPVSGSPSRSGSPFQQGGRSSPFGQPLRSATAPIRSPPSPQYVTGLDSPFPPFPGARSQSRPQTPQQRPQLQGGYGGLGVQRQDDYMFAPVSPRSATSGGLLQRMNTIAPGPFDPNSQRGAAPQASRGHERTKTTSSIRDGSISTSVPATRAHSQTASISSIHSHSSKNSMDRGITAPKVPRKNGYGGFGPPPTAESGFERPPLTPDSRSQTFPRQSQSQGPSMRRPSEPAAAPGFSSRMRRPSISSTHGDENQASPPRGRRPSTGPDTSRLPPPRGASLIRSSRNDSRLGDAPPVPSNVNLAAEFGIGNPYHTPTESTSSNGSGYSESSKASALSSPPSTSPAKSRRNNSDTSNIDLLMSEIQSSMTDLHPKEIPANAPPMKIDTTLPAPAPEPIAPKSSYGVQEPKPLGSSYGVQEPKSYYGAQDASMLSPDFLEDPAVQGGRAPPVLTRNNPSGTSRRPTTSKGTCKHCKLPIKSGQKSVSSADGRLTGRYHKSCFCCTTCLEPFSTATFYVISDAPYCERHYHKLNGSVCTTCDKGIEGQYLESERRQKFHPGCLTCADCRRTLRNDYFEMDGRVYCERDAFRRTQQQRSRSGYGGRGGGLGVPGTTSRMQRRTTRLMMM